MKNAFSELDLPVCGRPAGTDMFADRAALVVLYNAMGGADWANSSNWLSEAPIGEWHGVTTDPDGRVTQVDLDNNQLTGPIPPELGKLTGLRSLNLFANQLTGTIPPELGNLANLQELQLSKNQLTGEIPPELGNLVGLRLLDLGENRLAGPIPSQLGNLADLQWLRLSGNHLTGCIPTGLNEVQMIDPASLDLPICGEPDEPAGVVVRVAVPVTSSDPSTDRDVLVALYNATGGANWMNKDNWLSERPIREWHGVTTDSDGRVTELNLNHNQLTGPIPPELGNLTNLLRLDLTGNPLSGEVPPWLGDFANLEWLGLAGNKLTGCLPFKLLGVPNMTLLIDLPLCVRTAGADAVSDRAALVAFYNATDGANWENNDNWVSDRPIGEWRGVTTDASGRVVQLVLPENQLNGTIPTELGDLKSLVLLSLSSNNLSGVLPPELGDLDSLERLYLSRNELRGAIPSTLGDLSKLGILALQGNRLSGAIPPELGSLFNLEALFLQLNQLTGAIPPKLGDMTLLVNLYLSGNQLTGTVPPELGNLTRLEGLHLSGNQLTGCIPSELKGVPYNDFDKLGLPFCSN